MFKIAYAKVATSVAIGLLMSGGVQAQVIERVSLDSGSLQAQGASSGTVAKDMVSDDGRYVVFSSLADNLVADDDNAEQDVFLSWGPAVVMMDGFESAGTSLWSTTVPNPGP